MSRTVPLSAGRACGLARVCRVWRPSRATVFRRLRTASRAQAPRCRPGPQGQMSGDALAGRVRALLAASPVHGEGCRKVWARLRVAGIRAGPRRVLRVMRENALLAHRRPGTPRGRKARDGRITTDRADEMRGTGLAGAMTGKGAAAVFIAVDRCSADCVGIHASHRATRHEALEPVRQAARRSFGAIGRDVAAGLGIRHDHGSQDMSGDFQKEIRVLGAESSPAFVRAPEGNGCAERFIRTLKETLLRVRWFETIGELRQALLHFQRTDNEEWIIQRHGYRTPAQVRQEQIATMQEAAQALRAVS